VTGMSFADSQPVTRRQRAISRVPYLPGLDGLRALAVVVVMIYHANADWLPGGFLGVEVFFVISGYLITLLIVAEHEKHGRIDLGHFWFRRARRLLPALFVMMFMVVTYTAVFRSDALGQLRGDVLAGLFYVTNWYQIWVGQGYAASGDFSPLRHLWSLAVEEQFYLVWPLVMVALLSVGPRRIVNSAKWMVLAALAVTIFTALTAYTGRVAACSVTPDAYWTVGERCISKADTLYLSSITRSSGLLLGAAFALVWRPAAIMRSPMRNKAPLVDLLALVGLVGLAALTWTLHFMTPSGVDPWLFRGGFLVAAVLTLLVIAAVTHQRSLMGPLLGNPVFLWVGTRSYGLYLYHWPIYQMIRGVAGNPLTLNEFAIAMVLTAFVTEVSYRFVETPIRTGQVGAWWAGLRRSRDPLPRQIVLASAATAVALGLFSGVSLATAPLKQNEIAVSLDQASESVTDLEDLLGGGATPPAETAPPATVPGTGPADPSVTTVPASTTTTTTTTTTTIPPEPIPLLAIGDSVMLGAAPILRDNGVVVDAQESRQMIDAVPLMEKLRDLERYGLAVVVHLGTNGPISQDTVDAFMAPLAGVPNVIVLTVKGSLSWTNSNNEKLRALAGRPNVILLDWELLAAQCPGDCFYRDEIHLRPEGQAYYSRLIFDVLGI
jgi:peptidoglycan/LPS O-acetylase OafA/YrhL